MPRRPYSFYYARMPSDAAPATTLVGPYSTEWRVTEALRKSLSESERSLPGAQRWSEYAIIRVVARYQPKFTSRLNLLTPTTAPHERD